MASNLSPEQVEWSNNAPLQHQLPFVFDNGLKFNGFNAQCSGCSQYIAEQNLHGFVSSIGVNRCVLTAYGLCTECNGITSYNFILTAADSLIAEPIYAVRQSDH